MARPHTAIDRRALITGRLLTTDRVVAPPGGEIASILVQARPERLIGVEAAGEGLDKRHSATISKGRPGVLHGMQTIDADQQDAANAVTLVEMPFFVGQRL